jgi:uncharacterized Rmd1/YagE family protein
VSPSPPIHARALLIGDRLDLRALEAAERLATGPLVIPTGARGRAVLFRYGAIVLFDVDPAEEVAFLHQLSPFVSAPLPQPEIETLTLRVDPMMTEGMEKDILVLHDLNVERLQVVADVLAKSSVLGLYEKRVAQSFDRIEPLAMDLQHHGRGVRRARDLLNHIGATLLTQHRMVGRAEIIEKPELLWERPQLESLFLRLEDEFELKERAHALERKLDLISKTAETLLDLLQAERGLRVEWYITLLIVVEIGLTLYELFLRGHGT